MTRGGLDTVAVRCPSNIIARSLIEAAGVAIAAPSANLSGSPSPTEPEHVIDDMLGRCDVIIDGGSCDFGLESTIVKINDDDSLTLLRPGKITLEDLRAAGFSVDVAAAVSDKLGDGEVALSPGMKYRHYAPEAPVVLLDGDDDACAEFIKNEKRENIAIISYTESIELYRSEIPDAVIYDFGSRGLDTEQAHRLFALLRKADKCKFGTIYAPLPSKDGIGLALYNRMIRAAAHKIIRL
jgi:L-threonylcarbamoyladenylate synthase